MGRLDPRQSGAIVADMDIVRGKRLERSDQ
jgi:hypothetical protein